MSANHIMYLGKPLVRQGQQFCWGNPTDKYVLVLGIMSTKKVDGGEVPDQMLIQIQSTADKKVVKFGTKNGLAEAFEYGAIWLDTELKKA
ncbi:MAG: hypothetical protein E7632_03025 [Ruminococcaceae bacterium]|nr:hypothetical protein [Oscillospiraceae bacterium]